MARSAPIRAGLVGSSADARDELDTPSERQLGTDLGPHAIQRPRLIHHEVSDTIAIESFPPSVFGWKWRRRKHGSARGLIAQGADRLLDLGQARGAQSPPYCPDLLGGPASW
jgi:hypothetical protein